MASALTTEKLTGQDNPFLFKSMSQFHSAQRENLPQPVETASVEWCDGPGAKGISCELKETFVEYFCCFIWLTAYKRKKNLTNVKEERL